MSGRSSSGQGVSQIVIPPANAGSHGDPGVGNGITGRDTIDERGMRAKTWNRMGTSHPSCGADVDYLGLPRLPIMKNPMLRKTSNMLFGMLLLLAMPTTAQVIDDPFESVGDETYLEFNPANNWTAASDFGFTDHAGPTAFLSAYGGVDTLEVGIVKPLGGNMQNTTYDVSFYFGKYWATGLAFSDLYQLYIGSPDGISVWDSVPTPTVDGEWLKWSGTFTPAVTDIGQPFHFGFSLTYYPGHSFAIDGPVQVFDPSTGIAATTALPAPELLYAPGMRQVTVLSSRQITDPVVFDSQGRCVQVRSEQHQQGMTFDTSSLPPGHYSVRFSVDGAPCAKRFVVL